MSIDIFTALLHIDDAIVDYILVAAPHSDEAQAELKQLFVLRGELDKALNQLVSRRLKLAAQKLTLEAAALHQIADAVRTVERKIECVQRMLELTGEAVAIANKLLGAVAA